ncbi:hypothetical protein [Pedobacter sp. CFBP9032]|uniref:hypothetical protein n=1 Tax=Pedobacter sp. CFBP9032 TaxID=3096539 RepID=UPI002A6B8D4A|nr:hypothetical protein [Pedobacter sp. CFBP9032]MDY0906579.1 hypothetical protein [Pedobacter sp. CFBP9032]
MNKEHIEHALHVIKNIKVNTSNFYQIQESAATTLHNQLDNVREEICRCICFNLYQAAIALTNHLSEAFLRLNIAIKESGATDFNDEALEKIHEKFTERDGHELGKMINSAKRLGIITKDQAKKLGEYREQWRNPFSHGSPHQLLKDAGDITMVTIDLKADAPFPGVDIKEVKMQSQFHLHGLFQGAKASNDAIPYFRYVDELIIAYYDKINNI